MCGFIRQSQIEVKFYVKLKNESLRIDGLPFKESFEIGCTQSKEFVFGKDKNEVVLKVKLKSEKRTIIKTTQVTNGDSNTKSWQWEVKANISDKKETKIGEVQGGIIGGGGRGGSDTHTEGNITTTTETFEVERVLSSLDIKQI